MKGLWLAASAAALCGCAAQPALFDAHVHLNDVAMQLALMDEHGVERAVGFWGRRSDNARVLEAAAALEAGDLAALGRLFYASHASMRDLFGISSPELDALVEIASEVDGVIGARLTGAGFGGCTINLVHRAAVPSLREAVLRRYPERTGLVPRVFEVAASPGARRVA